MDYTEKQIIYCNTPFKVNEVLKHFKRKIKWVFPFGCYYHPLSGALLDNLQVSMHWDVLMADDVLTNRIK